MSMVLFHNLQTQEQPQGSRWHVLANNLHHAVVANDLFRQARAAPRVGGKRDAAADRDYV
jgi:hypothetical protein